MTIDFPRSIRRLLGAVSASGTMCLFCPVTAVSAMPAPTVDNTVGPLRSSEMSGGPQDLVVNGTPVTLEFDTGSSFFVLLSEPCVHRLAISLSPEPLQKAGEAGYPSLRKTVPVPLKFFGNDIAASELPVYTVPPGTLPVGDPGTDGLIGWPAMRSEIMGFFLARHEFGGLETVPSVATGWVHWKVREADVLLVSATAPDRTDVLIRIDTGSADGVLLAHDDWVKWRKEHPIAPTSIALQSMFGDLLRATEECWASRYTVAGLDLTEVPVGEASAAYHLESVTLAHGIVLGRAALARLNLVVDGPSQVAYVSPSSEPAPSYEHNTLGVAFAPSESNSIVARVAPRSPAEIAGMRTGDVLVQVNGVAVRSWEQYRRLPLLEKSLNWTLPPHVRVQLTVRRGNSEIPVTLVTRTILGPNSEQER